MGETPKKHRVQFEPVDLEMEVTEDETVLDAAFRQGIMLMHGCREGQCSACKSFLLDGDVEMDRYSTFALPDFESDEGYVLLCKTRAYSDLTVELINFDEEALRNAVPIQTLTATVVELDELTHDIVSLAVRPDAPFEFKPGQYADLTIPGTTEHRSFSMATLPDQSADRVQFIIKKYPGGHFSGLLDGVLQVGHSLQLIGPYGSFTLREKSDRKIVCIGGGAGMAPILSLLRQLAAQESQREIVFYYGARTARDLFHFEELAGLSARLPHFTFVPALSDPSAAEDASVEELAARGQTSELGLITDVVDRREGDLADSDCYLCGPPPMVDAALALLDRRSVPQEQVFYDKFTTSTAS
ncbi:2Fe-2S iron-sulfur cluster-binding protein [Modestobacter lapidis]|nr:2Fe-2S iron-sulfur cluster binding domain-containing protein [Modestobacter lapidis]